MESIQICPSCGTPWDDGVTCEGYFHQMLFWESEFPEYTLDVHHLIVLCYHLQHPHLYSPEGLVVAKGLLLDFVERGISPQTVRKREAATVDSGKRDLKITARADSVGAYAHPVKWTMTAKNITTGNIEDYAKNVNLWASSVLDALKVSGNL